MIVRSVSVPAKTYSEALRQAYVAHKKKKEDTGKKKKIEEGRSNNKL